MAELSRLENLLECVIVLESLDWNWLDVSLHSLLQERVQKKSQSSTVMKTTKCGQARPPNPQLRVSMTMDQRYDPSDPQCLAPLIEIDLDKCSCLPAPHPHPFPKKRRSLIRPKKTKRRRKGPKVGITWTLVHPQVWSTWAMATALQWWMGVNILLQAHSWAYPGPWWMVMGPLEAMVCPHPWSQAPSLAGAKRTKGAGDRMVHPLKEWWCMAHPHLT